jgi:hypothetical protein
MASGYPPLAVSPSSPASLPLPHTNGGGRAQLYLWKSVRGNFRSVSTRARSFYRRQPRLAKILFLVLFFCLASPLVFGAGRHVHHLVNTQKTDDQFGFSREDMHFKRLVHLYVAPQKRFSQADMSPCSWVYLEVNAYDGRDIDGFFRNANGVFEEALRAEQAPSRAFCAYAFESDLRHSDSLLGVRKDIGLFSRRLNVFPGISVAAADADSSSAGKSYTVQLSRLVRNVTLPLADSGSASEAVYMVVATANGYKGSVFVRISGSFPELYAHLDALWNTPGVLCDRVDRLVLNVTNDVRDIRVALPYSPSAEKFRASLGLDGLKILASELETRPHCRTRLFVTDEEGSLVIPVPMDQKAVFYAVLAGAPTFDERVSAQTDSWMRGVPLDRVALYTNVERPETESDIVARGRPVVVVGPNMPSLEKHLAWMQSWSHLVRVRETWDRYMKDDPNIQWLALVDDDTLVFPAGMREYLTMFDHRLPVWGGSGEQARIDNGDHGEFALWLRNLSTSHGGAHCYLSTEDVPENMRGSHEEFQKSKILNGRLTRKKVSHMCHDNFCRRGCPSVPQGAAIVLSRVLVELLRPSVEACEAATSTLCDRCGSQRLYMCVNRYVKDARTLLTRGICRASWKLEHRHNFPIALTYHAFTRNPRLSSMTGSIHGDMAQLWRLGEDYEGREPWQGTVPMPEVANLLGCNGEGRYNHDTGSCDPFDATADTDKNEVAP